MLLTNVKAPGPLVFFCKQAALTAAPGPLPHHGARHYAADVNTVLGICSRKM